MKIRWFILLTLILTCSFASAQFKFKNDRDFRYFSDSVNKFAKIPPPDFSKADFEMRFYVISYSNFPNAIYIFVHNRSRDWNLTRYRFCSFNMKNCSNLSKDMMVVSDLWRNRWDTLLKSHILTLPPGAKVEKRWRESNGMVIAIADGVGYWVELLTKKKRRRYNYDNPEEILKSMNTDNQEFVDFVNIIHILDNETRYAEAPAVQCP